MTLGEISQSFSALFFLNDSLQNRSALLPNALLATLGSLMLASSSTY